MKGRYWLTSLITICVVFFAERFLSGDQKPSQKHRLPATQVNSPSNKHKDISNQKNQTQVLSPVPKQEKPEFSDFDSQWDIKKTFSNLKKIEECYTLAPGSCGFPTTDPKAEYFAIGQRLKKDLLLLQDKVSRSKLKQEAISELARHFMKVSDGHVKEAALHLMATQDTNDENLETILNEIIHYHDAHLIQQAMLELQRYLDNSNQAQKIHTHLSFAIKNGAPFVGEQIAKHLKPFMNTRSLNVYSITLESVSKGSKTHTYLKNAIAEYRRQLGAA